MTNAPHLLKNSRKGYKYGAVEMLDSMALDGADRRVRRPVDGRVHRTATTQGSASPARSRTSSPPARSSAPRGPPRTACSPRRSSRSRSSRARTTDRLRHRRGHPRRHDRGVAGASCRAAFGADGTITAGSSSQISDGAAARHRDEPREGRASSAPTSSPRSARSARWPARTTPAPPAVERDQEGARQGRPRRRRPGPDRDQRGVRRGRHRSPCASSASAPTS